MQFDMKRRNWRMLWYGISFLVIVTLAIFGNIYVYKMAEKKAKEMMK